ncbi:EVE domain-containing protein [Halomonas denitrificans]|nr:EVE domain-containing protein [Halomonas denitrificans]
MAYWLFKTEPDTFSIDTLKAQGTSCWEGVRNYQARNLMRDEVKLGDEVFIYHSSCKHVGVAGIATVTREAYPDHHQFNPESPYFDPKSDPNNPRWIMVDVAYQQHLPLVSLKAIKANPALAEMVLVNRSRLSIQPVTEAEWHNILAMAGVVSESC